MGIINSATLRPRLLVRLTAGFLLAALVIVPAAVFAIARGYNTDDTGIQVGMVVALASDKSEESKIERATQQNSQRVVGVVTNFDSSLVTVASSSKSVLVESEGQVAAYVTDLNGEVTKGSLLAISPFKGVLMKAKEGQTGAVVGIAEGNASSVTPSSTPTYDNNGTKKQTKITKIQVNLNGKSSSTGNGQETNALAKFGKSITGRQVSEIRVLLALVMFVIVLVAEGGILYGAISSAIVALGRNPLARKVIRRELVRVIMVAIGVLFVGLGGVYAVLWF